MVIEFAEIVCKLGLASNQVNAIRTILCINEDVYISGRTLFMFAADFPTAFRDWIYVNNPDQVFFSGVYQNIDNNKTEPEILNYD